MQPQTASPRIEKWSLLPCSLASLCVHALILIIAGMSLRGCDKGAPSAAGGRDYREIGLAIVPNSAANPAENSSTDSQNGEAEQPTEQPQHRPVQEALPTEVPSAAEMLGHDQPNESEAQAENADRELPETIGPGAPIGGLPSVGTGIPELIRPRSRNGGGAAGSLTPGPGDTSFMNIVGNGQTFVYVIDISSSMGGGRLDLAKSQLKSSLRLLKPNQRFQILFYNDQVKPVEFRTGPKQDLYEATVVKVQLAEFAIDAEEASSGTKHMPPLLAALALNPDVVYFLTDGAEPSLSPAELKAIRRANRSDAQIHVVEFASGARESRDPTWLQHLASQSGAKYVYIPNR